MRAVSPKYTTARSQEAQQPARRSSPPTPIKDPEGAAIEGLAFLSRPSGSLKVLSICKMESTKATKPP
jgi:hypothetical protein